MKTFLPILTLAVVMTACGNDPKIGAPHAANIVSADTTGLAAFQQWKSLEAKHDKTNTVYVVKEVPARNDNSQKNNNDYGNQQPVPSTSNDYPGAAEPETVKKKGWSKAAKGAAIGAGSGAVLGAVIHKRNRVAGGVAGGVIGAGVGYGIGRHIDKKDGRY